MGAERPEVLVKCKWKKVEFLNTSKFYQHFNYLFIYPSPSDQNYWSPPVSAPIFTVWVTLGPGSLLARLVWGPRLLPAQPPGQSGPGDQLSGGPGRAEAAAGWPGRCWAAGEKQRLSWPGGRGPSLNVEWSQSGVWTETGTRHSQDHTLNTLGLISEHWSHIIQTPRRISNRLRPSEKVTLG